jgi:LysM repeat protein
VSTYTVGKGDSLWSIAKKNHLTVSELAKANNVGTGAALQPGKKLIIPGKVVAPAALKDAPAVGTTAKPAGVGLDKSAAPAAHAGSEAVKHTVVAGESLGVIARKYQISAGELAAANNITDPSKIRAGQQLVIPGYKGLAAKGTGPAPKASGTTKPATTAKPATTGNAPAEKPAAPAGPHFELTPPPPGQDLDSGLKDAGTEVPTIKVEDATAGQPPKN